MFFGFFARPKTLKALILLAVVPSVIVGCAINSSGTRVSELLTQAGRQQFLPLQTEYPGLILSKNFEVGATPLWVFIEVDGTPFDRAHRLTNLPWGSSENCVNSTYATPPARATPSTPSTCIFSKNPSPRDTSLYSCAAFRATRDRG